MVSSLAAQLAGSKSLNSAQLVDRSKRKFPESYLFSGRDADQHDLESLFALGLNGLAALKNVDAAFADFDNVLFAETYKDVDRTLLSEEQHRQLKEELHALVPLLAPHLLEASSGKVLEWLVRRFRINEFDVDLVLEVFLPYHESPQFTKMLSILHIKGNSPWSFLLPFKASGKGVPRSIVVKAMLNDSDTARAVVSLLPNAIASASINRTLLAFYTAALVEFIRAKSSLNAETLAYILPAVIQPTRSTATPCKKDSILSSYIILSVLAQTCTLSAEALIEIVKAILRSRKRVESMQLVTALMSILGPQPDLQAFPNDVVDGLVRLEHFSQTVRTCMSWTAMDKVLKPMLSVLVGGIKDAKKMTFLEFLLTLPDVPQNLLDDLTRLVLISLTSENPAETDGQQRLFKLLSELHQRYPTIVQSCAKEALSDNQLDSKHLESILSRSAIPLPFAQDNEMDRLVLGACNVDANIRSIAIRDIVDYLEEKGSKTEENELASLQATIRTRLLDSDTAVLESVYHKPNVILPIVSTKDFLREFADSLAKQDLPRSALRLHLNFFCNPFSDANTNLQEDVFFDLVFGHLLFTKPKQKSASVAWSIFVNSSLAKNATLAFLQDSSELLKKSQDTSLSNDEMAQLNLSIASNLAENVRVSKHSSRLLNSVLQNLDSSSINSKLFAYLTLISAFRHSRGPEQVQIARAILDRVPFGNDLSKWSSAVASIPDEQVDVALDDEILRNVVLKPHSTSTFQKVQARLVLLLPNVQSGDDSIKLLSQEEQGAFYGVISSLYLLANASDIDQSISTRLNRTLFMSLDTASLMFFVSIWSRSTTAENLRYVALRHAADFFQAQPKDCPLDFQCILPSVLHSAQSEDGRVRAASLDCMSIMADLSHAAKSSAIYAYDNVYGNSSETLQYLNWVDFGKYLRSLHDHTDHLANDSNYLAILHQNAISPSKAELKKDSKYRNRIMCYLLSHIISCPLGEVRLSLLRMIQGIADKVKIQMLLPTIALFLKKSPDDVTKVEMRVFDAMIQCFDKTAVKFLNTNENESWSIYLSIFHCCQAGKTFLWPSLAKQLENGLFGHLNLDRQIELTISILKLGITWRESATGTKSVLGSLINNEVLIVQLLTTLRPLSANTPQRASKRARLDSALAEPQHEDNIILLIALMEALMSQTLPGTLTFISCILETLNIVLSEHGNLRSDLAYLEQLFMSAIENSMAQIQESKDAKLAPHSLRVDILVDRLRVSENMQTFHQALLLLSGLARLAPESVLQNVMPIFTFMGSNVFHRDDAYSLRVIQKTMQSIVPVLIDSLKSRHTDLVDLRQAAQEFLTVFTDASIHIPRHRRTSFFTQLIAISGSAEFLPPICMLLADKCSSRAIKQSPQECDTLLSLPLSVLESYDKRTKIQCLKEVVAEVQITLRNIEGQHEGSSMPSPFLPAKSMEDSSLSLHALRRRQCYALLLFIGHSFKYFASDHLQKEADSEVSFILSSLIGIVGGDEAGETYGSEIRLAAHWAISESLKVISTEHFTRGILSMLNSSHQKVQIMALGLLADRLPQMTVTGRETISPVIIQILDILALILSPTVTRDVLLPALKVIEAVVSTARTQEEARLVNFLPLMLVLVQQHVLVTQAMGVLRTFIVALGPRIISHLELIVSTCMTVLAGHDDEARENTIGVLIALVKTVAPFLGKTEIKAIATICLDLEGLSVLNSQQSHLDDLARAVAKRISSQTLLPVLSELAPLQIEQSAKASITAPLLRLYHLLKRALQEASRADVLANIRPLFSQFLEAFDSRSRFSQEVIELEDCIIGTFLEVVVKLSEAAFSPLFRRLYDWGFADESVRDRRITFCRLYSSLIETFKSLMTPYMSLLLGTLAEHLESFCVQKDGVEEMWLCIIELLHKSFMHDDGVFWRDDRLRRISKALTDQITVCVERRFTSGRDMLASCLRNMVDCAEDDALLKSINTDILYILHTRSDDSRVRLFALSCSLGVWENYASKLLSFVPETSTFILECGEDENDEVVKEARKLKKAIEKEAGTIAGL